MVQQIDDYLSRRPAASEPTTDSDRDFLLQGGVLRTIDPRHTASLSESTAYVLGQEGFETLAAAITTLAGAAGSIYISVSTSTDTLTIPANVEIVPMNGAFITVNAGQTLTYYGNTSRWPLVKIFAGAGTVHLSGTRAIAHPEWFGAVNDNTTDCYAAINAAINAVTSPVNSVYETGGYYRIGGLVLFSMGDYYVSQTIYITRQVILQGITSPMGNSVGASRLQFPDNMHGVVVNSYYDSVGAGDGTTIENLYIVRNRSRGGGGTVGNGIYARSRVVLKNIIVNGFRQDGISIDCAELAPWTTEGNANGWQAHNVRTAQNGRHGFYVRGADANAGVGIAIDASSNGASGIYDESFLGNTYIGCQTDANIGPAYVSAQTTASNVFIGCYTEGGQPASVMNGPSISFGGTNDLGTAGGYSLVGGIMNGFRVATGSYYNTLGSTGASYLFGSIGNASSETLQKYTDYAESAYGSAAMTFDHKTRAGNRGFGLNWNGDVQYASYELWPPTAAKSNGWARDIVPSLLGGHVATNFQAGFMLFDRCIGSSATPTAAANNITYEKGDIVLNNNPAPSGYIGSVCTTAGTGGTLTGITAGTTSGSTTITVNSTTGLFVGAYITIVGVTGVKQIRTMTPSITIDSAASATVAGAAVAFSAPVIKAWGAIAA